MPGKIGVLASVSLRLLSALDPIRPLYGKAVFISRDWGIQL
jgi:hypothetical protein